MLTSVIGDVNTIEDVVAAMRAIEAALPEKDGVRWFNVLYRRVTEAVRADASPWEDWPFLERFDVAFAKLYFEAIISWESNPAGAPRAWRPLFQARGSDKAHAAAVRAGGHECPHQQRSGDRPRSHRDVRAAVSVEGGGRYRDFQRVNDVLERVEVELQPVLSTGVIDAIDVALGDLDTVLAMWKVRHARDTAWTNGEVVWHLRVAPHLRRDYLSRLDRMVGFAGRGPLAPLPQVAKARAQIA